MVFTSHIFVFYFLPLVLLGYYLLPRRGRNVFLLLASYVFYGWWRPGFLVLMLFTTVVNYAAGEVMSRGQVSVRRRRAGVIGAVVVSLGTLAAFKYYGFFQGNLNQVLSWLGVAAVHLPDLPLPLGISLYALPMGISFYMFQSLSYTVDVYRGTSEPVRSFLDFACYVALFPQLVAGPIVRYNTVSDQLVNRTHSLNKFSAGTALFILGFAKKILLANPIGQVADATFAASSPGMLDAWFGVTAYAFQIYFDFSAYSDMAVGLGRLFGFEFLKNFNSPYLAESITDFWRRWHISLSTFLRDYLYIPLGGNRKGVRRTYVNLAIVMLLGGLWHGANWTFVAWGAYHGVLLASERWLGKTSFYSVLPRPLRVASTFVLVLISWVFFRSGSIGEAWRYVGVMFGVGAGGSVFLAAQIYTRSYLATMVLCALLVLWPLQAYDWSHRVTWPKVAALAPTFAVSLAVMFEQAYNPFLYFQF